jgi:hypothetical protein
VIEKFDDKRITTSILKRLTSHIKVLPYMDDEDIDPSPLIKPLLDGANLNESTYENTFIFKIAQ